MKNYFPPTHVCNRAVAKIIELQKPLNKFDGLHLVYYGKYYPADNTGFLFYTNKPFFIVRMALNVPFVGTYLDDNIHPWHEVHSESIVKIAQDFNIYHPINLIKKNDNYTDSFTFAFSQKINPGMSFYLSHLDTLKQFTAYFKNQASDLIAEAEKTRIKVPEHLQGAKAQIKSDYNQDIQLLQMNIAMPDELANTTNPLHALTKRELLCLCYYLMGRTAAEIATSLHLSPKTVSAHLFNARVKLACKNKSELFKKAWELGLIYSNFINQAELK